MAEITGFIRGDASNFIAAVASARVALAQFRDLARRTAPQVSQSLNTISTSARRVRNEFNQAAIAVRRLGAEARNAGARVVRVQARLVSLERTTGTLNLGIASLAGSFLLFRGISAVEDAIRSTVRLVFEVERATAEVSTLVDTASVPVEKILRNARELTRAFGFEAVDSIKAAYQAISAGVAPAEVVGFLAENAKLATAGLTDLANTVDITTSVINAFGFSIKDTGLISDVLFQTVKDGKVTLDDLVKSLGRAIPAAANSGVSFLDLNAAVATTTKGGINARESVTGLVQAFKGIVKPTNDARAVAKTLGIRFDSTALRVKGFSGFLKELRGALKESEEQGFDTIQMLNTLFGNIRATRVILPLVGNQFEQFERSLENTRNAAGNVDVASKKVAITLDRQLKIAVEEIRDIALEAGTQIAKLALDIIGAGKESATTRESIKLLGNSIRTMTTGPVAALRVALKLIRRDFKGAVEVLGETERASSLVIAGAGGVADIFVGQLSPAIGQVIGLTKDLAVKLNDGVTGLEKLQSFGVDFGISSGIGKFFNSIVSFLDEIREKTFLVRDALQFIDDLRSGGLGGGRAFFEGTDRRDASAAQKRADEERDEFLRAARRRTEAAILAADRAEAEEAKRQVAREQSRFTTAPARRRATELEEEQEIRAEKELIKQRNANLFAFRDAARLVDNAILDLNDELRLVSPEADGTRAAIRKQIIEFERMQATVNRLSGSSALAGEGLSDANKALNSIRISVGNFDLTSFLDKVEDQGRVASAKIEEELNNPFNAVNRSARRGAGLLRSSADQLRLSSDEAARSVIGSGRRSSDAIVSFGSGIRSGARTLTENARRASVELQAEFKRLFESPLGVVGTRKERDNLLREISGDNQAFRERQQARLDAFADKKAVREEESVRRLDDFNRSLVEASRTVATRSFEGLDTREGQRAAREAFIASENANRAALRRTGTPLSLSDLISPEQLFAQMLRQQGINVFGAQRGGTVPGVGSGDRVPALLEPGEEVVRKEEAPIVRAILQALSQGSAGGAPGTSLSIQNLTLNVEMRGQGGADLADGVVRRLVRLSDLGQVDQMARF